MALDMQGVDSGASEDRSSVHRCPLGNVHVLCDGRFTAEHNHCEGHHVSINKIQRDLGLVCGRVEDTVARDSSSLNVK